MWPEPRTFKSKGEGTKELEVRQECLCGHQICPVGQGSYRSPLGRLGTDGVGGGCREHAFGFFWMGKGAVRGEKHMPSQGLADRRGPEGAACLKRAFGGHGQGQTRSVAEAGPDCSDGTAMGEEVVTASVDGSSDELGSDHEQGKQPEGNGSRGRHFLLRKPFERVRI